MVGLKTCSLCKITKDLDSFTNKGQYKQSHCKSCRAEKQKDYVAKGGKKTVYNRQWHRRWHLKRYYGLSVEEYDAQKERQNGLCAICLCSPGDKTLAVDHDHKTGSLRGLLCLACNALIGYARDDAEVLGRAVLYLSNPPMQSK